MDERTILSRRYGRCAGSWARVAYIGVLATFALLAILTSAAAMPLQTHVQRRAATAGVYHLFVSSTGSASCTRNASLVDYTQAQASGNVCDSFGTAYSRAQVGDSVGVEPGTYGGQTVSFVSGKTTGNCRIGWSGGGYSSDTASCITFEPDGGGVPLSGDVTLSGGIWTNASGVRFRNLTLLRGGATVSWKSSPTGVPCGGGVTQPHDVVFDGIRMYDNVTPPGGTATGEAGIGFFASGVREVAFVNGEIGPMYDSNGASQTANIAANQGSCGPNIVPDYHILIGSTNYHDLKQTYQANYPNTLTKTGTTLAVAASAGATSIQVSSAANITVGTPISVGPYTSIESVTPTSVVGTTLTLSSGLTFSHAAGENVGTGCSSNGLGGCNHTECIHWRASDSWVVNNLFRGCAQYGINVQTFSGSGGVPTINNTQVIGNVFDAPCSTNGSWANQDRGQTGNPCGAVKAFAVICNAAADAVTNFVVAYNSINATAPWQGPSGCTFTGSVEVGNIESGAAAFFCTQFPHNQIAIRYNRYTSASAAPCDATDAVLGTNPYVDAASGDYHVTAAGYAAGVGNAVPPSVVAAGNTVACPSQDRDGNRRPKPGNTNCAAGAYEQDGIPPVLSLPSDITTDATGPSGAVVTYSATATDNVDGPVPVNCSPASGSTFPVGTTTVNCSAQDSAGNVANGSFTVTVRAAPTFVKELGSRGQGFGSTLSLTTPAGGVAAGNLVVLVVHAQANTPPTLAISDSRGNSYTVATTSFRSNSKLFVAVAYSVVSTALAQGDTITVNFGVSEANSALIGTDYTGENAAAPLDKTAVGQGFGAPATANTATTTQANELVVGGFSLQSTAAVTPGSGFTADATQTASTSWEVFAERKAVSATGQYAASASVGGNVGYAGVVATFK